MDMSSPAATRGRVPTMPSTNLGPDWQEEMAYLDSEVLRMVELARNGAIEDLELNLRLLLSLNPKGAPRPVDCGKEF